MPLKSGVVHWTCNNQFRSGSVPWAAITRTSPTTPNKSFNALNSKKWGVKILIFHLLVCAERSVSEVKIAGKCIKVKNDFPSSLVYVMCCPEEIWVWKNFTSLSIFIILTLFITKLLFPLGILEAETFSSASLPLDWKALDILLNINKLFCSLVLCLKIFLLPIIKNRFFLHVSGILWIMNFIEISTNWEHEMMTRSPAHGLESLRCVKS